MNKKNNDVKFWGLLIVGFVLVLIAMFTPPLAIVDNSIILLVGQITLLIGGLLECCVHIDIKNGYLHIGRMEKHIKEIEYKNVNVPPDTVVEDETNKPLGN